MDKRKAIIVDLDGTLCDVEHRLHFIKSEKKDWDSFHQNCEHDTVELWCQNLIAAMKAQGHTIILMTGRDDPYREITENWLVKNKISYDLLLMRKEKDFRPDQEVKSELYDEHVKKDFEIEFIVEDRDSVVSMWRQRGFRVLQCAPGNF